MPPKKDSIYEYKVLSKNRGLTVISHAKSYSLITTTVNRFEVPKYQEILNSTEKLSFLTI